MANPKARHVAVRGKFVKANREKDAAQMYLDGKTQTEIAGELGVNQKTISNDLAAVTDRLHSQAVGFRQTQIQRQLDEALWRETELKEAWAKSKESLKHSRTKRKVNAQGQPVEDGEMEATLEVEQQLANVSYMSALIANDAHVAKILGLYTMAETNSGPEIAMKEGEKIVITKVSNRL